MAVRNRRRVTQPYELVKAGWLLGNAIECLVTSLQRVHTGSMFGARTNLESAGTWAECALMAACRAYDLRELDGKFYSADWREVRP